MIRLQLPGITLPFSRIGLGCMRLSLERPTESFALVDAYLEQGGNLFDTAEIYGRGESERALGAYFARSGGRADTVIVTKGCVESSLVRPEYIRQAITRSLERLQTDTIDIYLLHRDDPSVPVLELLDVLNEAVRLGRIRAFGGSNWSTARLAEANRAATNRGMNGFSVSSPHLALAIPREPWWAGCTHATSEDLRWYARQQMLVLGWSTQCRGFFAQEPFITDTAYLAEVVRVYYSPANLEKRRRLHDLANRRRVAPAALAVAYVLSLDFPIVALVGPLAATELHALMAADDISLSASERKWLNLEV